jgi:Abnormal spindle-like microcephaly-assoc'd, ASPM-SPD-2-Hydin
MRQRTGIPRNWLAAAIVLLAAALSVSCGSAGANAHSTTTSATLSLTTNSVDFGNVSVGGSKTESITLTNSSASDGPTITVTQLATTGTGFSVKNISLPDDIVPGDSLAISVVFAPKSDGDANGSLAITVAGASDPATVTLSGTGVGSGQLGVSPGTLNFGSVTTGSSKSLTGTLTAGSSSITVSSGSWSGTGYSVSGINFPVTIGAGKSVSYTVTFAPQASGSASGSISFISNASNSPTTEKFSGSGADSTSPSGGPSVSLSWSPSSSSSTAGYYVYRGNTSGGPYSRVTSVLLTATTYNDNSVQSGNTYYYVVTAADSLGNESSDSNEASATVP